MVLPVFIVITLYQCKDGYKNNEDKLPSAFALGALFSDGSAERQ